MGARGSDGRRGFELPRGTLELLVLRTLARGAAHGYAIAREIESRSAGALGVEEGSLYPALHRLEHQGALRAEWGTTDSGRGAKFYALTDEGRRRLAAERKAWEQMTSAVGAVLRGRTAGA